MASKEIPYKIYLNENEMPKYWYNLRADMKNKPAPLLNPGTGKPMTAEELGGVFCEDLVRQELDNDTREYPVPQEILDFYKMYRPSPLVRAYCLEKKLGTPATVLTVGADGALTLQAGILRVTAKTEEVKLAESASPDKKKFLRETESKLRNLSVSPEVDLRGLTGEEALLMLERYLDSARMAKLNTVRIIHGKGTGALRKTVQDYLRRSGDVRSFRIGRYGEGEDGVTIAEIKV